MIKATSSRPSFEDYYLTNRHYDESRVMISANEPPSDNEAFLVSVFKMLKFNEISGEEKKTQASMMKDNQVANQLMSRKEYGQFARLFSIFSSGCTLGRTAPTVITTKDEESNSEEIRKNFRTDVVLNFRRKTLLFYSIQFSIMSLISLIVYDLFCSKLPLIYKHDMTMQALRNQLKLLKYSPSSSSMIKSYDCANWTTLPTSYRKIYKEVELISFSLTELGMPARANLGIYFTSLISAAMSPFVFYCWPTLFLLLAEGRRIRAPSLAFVLQPDLAMQILRKRIRNIARDFQKGPVSLITPNKLVELEKVYCKNREQSVEFLKRICSSPALQQQVVSSICSYAWRLGFNRLGLFVLISLFFITNMTANGLTLSCTLSDTIRNLEQRLNEIRCQYIYGTSYIHANPIILGLRTIKAEDKIHYEEFYKEYLHINTQNDVDQDNSSILDYIKYSLAYLWLLMRLEWFYFVDWIAFCTFLETAILLGVLGLCISFWNLVYVMEFVRTSTLLYQVLARLKWCCKQLEQVASFSEAQDQATELSLVMAFVEYEYFRRNFCYFQQITRLMVYISMLLMASVFVPVYFIASSIEADLRLFYAIVAISIMWIVNTYLMIALWVPKLIANIMKQLMTLAAQMRCVRPDLQTMRVLQLWRLQYLDAQDLGRFSGVSFFGYVITYKNLVAINVNIIGLLLLVWRVQSQHDWKGR